MPFLGSTPADKYQSLAKQTITGDGSTAYTLNRSVTNAYDMEVFINNVRQEPDTSYSASGNTITFTAAVTASDSCYLIYQGQSVGSINPPANSVGTSQIVNDGVHTANIADTAVTHAKLHTDLNLSSKTLTMPADFFTGHILQIQSSPLLGQISFNTANTWNQTGHSCSITPQFSTSKIFVMLTTSIVHSNSAGDNLVQIKRGSTVVTGDNIYSSNSGWKGYNVTLMKLDSPATTSAITYTVQCWHDGGGSMLYNYTNQGFTESVITAMEVAQ